MSVLVLLSALGCDRPAAARPDPASGRPAAAEPDRAAAPPADPGGRPVELVLEPGRITDDGWESAASGADRLVAPAAVGGPPGPDGARRWRARLPAGPGVARVERAGCSAVEVPYVVTPVAIVVLPYPTCAAPDAPPAAGVRLDRTELPASLVETLRGLELFTDLPAPAPGEEDGPARWMTLAEARAICAWRGGRLPTEREWRAARVGGTGTAVSDATRDALGSGPVGAAARALAGVPPLRSASGHLDLDGNVDEWLADGRVAGGSWYARTEELGSVRAVPPTARSEAIGARCAFD